VILFQVGTSGETILFSDTVLAHLDKHRQTRWWHPEAGGLLFARFEGKRILIADISGPRRSDIRTAISYCPNRRAEQREINDRHRKGLHYVGDWHSHPEWRPSPSSRDERTMRSRVTQSRHELAGFVFAIIGLAPLPDGLKVVVHDGTRPHPLLPSDVPV